MFNGYYANSYLGKDGYPPYEGDDEAYGQPWDEDNEPWYWQYRDVWLMMKWNDAWLSNKDCDGDGKLDGHHEYDNYLGSGTWLTNHQRGEDDADPWTYFVKIVAVPEDAYRDGDTWYDADGNEIGPVIWGSFAVLLRVKRGTGSYDPSPSGPGFGKW